MTMYKIGDPVGNEWLQRMIAEGALVPVKATVEYRIKVDKGYTYSYYTKKDIAAADKGIADAYRDFKRYPDDRSTGFTAHIETRTVTGWEKWEETP